MTARPGIGFKIWTAFLSVTFALLLFPTIVGRQGVLMSLVYVGLGVGFIWLVYFGIGRLLEWAVSEELKRKGQKKSGNGSTKKPGDAGQAGNGEAGEKNS